MPVIVISSALSNLPSVALQAALLLQERTAVNTLEKTGFVRGRLRTDGFESKSFGDCQLGPNYISGHHEV